MKNLRLAAAAALAGALVILSSGAAQAYPDVTLELTTNSPVTGGHDVHFTAHASVNCDTLTVTFDDGTGHGTQTKVGYDTDTLTGEFDTHSVDSTVTTTMDATCDYTADNTAIAPAKAKSNAVVPAFYATSTASAIQAASLTVSASADVVILPKGHHSDGDNDNDNDNGALPNTGGSHLWIVFVGGALVLAGVGVTIAARRRSTTN